MNKALMYAKFVKYNVLDNLFMTNNTLKREPINNIDVYIDIQSLYKRIFSEDIVPSDSRILSVNILNMAAHYRHYFRSRFGKETNVFLIDSNSDMSGTICNSINIQNDILRILSILVPYFEKIYYIHRDKYNASAIIRYTMDERPSSTVSFVISNDIYAYQLPVISRSCYNIRPSTITKIVNMNNAIDTWHNTKSPTSVSDLDHSLLPLIMAINKCNELQLPVFRDYKNTVKIVRAAIRDNLIVNGYNTPSNIFGDNIMSRWYKCDLYTHYREYEHSPSICDTSWKAKKYSNFTDLANILDKYFNKDPDNILNYIYLVE